MLGSDGEVVLELIEGGRAFQCRLDLRHRPGHALGPGRGRTFTRKPTRPFAAPAPTTCTSQRRRSVAAVGQWHVDRVRRHDGVRFALASADHRPTSRRWLSPPARPHVEVSHLRVLRDIYYIATRTAWGRRTNLPDYESDRGTCRRLPTAAARTPFPSLRPVEFTLEADQFLALGDNSPRSKDSRLWNPKEHLRQPRPADRQGHVHLLAARAGPHSGHVDLVSVVSPTSGV